MWIIDGVELSEDVNRRMREYIITQMSNFLKFLLAVNEIEDSGTKTFDEVCAEKLYEVVYKAPKYMSNVKCLWDIIFNLLGIYIRGTYTPILSAYCRTNKIITKHDLFIKMSAELDSWIHTIDHNIDAIAFGISQKNDIWYIFNIYGQNYYNYTKIPKFCIDTLDLIIKNDFENIDMDPDSAEIYRIIPIRNKYDDPLQQVFYKYIMIQLMRYKLNFVKMTSNDVYVILSKIIYRFDRHINININIPVDEEIPLDNIDQIIEYAESKIPQYPAEIKDYLSIAASINRFIWYRNKSTIVNLAKMAELSNYNLRDLPIDTIISGLCGARPLHEIPLEDIPAYYARLTYNYSGKHTKPARI